MATRFGSSTGMAGGNFSSEMQRSDTFIRTESSTYNSRVRYATRYWQAALLRSITRFQLSGSHFRWAVSKISGMLSGLCGCPIYALKTSSDHQKFFEQESERLNLSLQFKSLLKPFMRRAASQVFTEPLSA